MRRRILGRGCLRGITTGVALCLLTAACGDDDSVAVESPASAPGGSAAAVQSSDWCGLVDELYQWEASVESVDLDEVGEVEVLVREYQSRLQQVADAAPEEIRRDAAALAEASGEMVAAYEDAGFSVADVDPLVVEELGRSIETTGARVEQFAADECGVSPPAPTIVEGTEDCEAIRRTLEVAIEAYRAMGRGVPPDESALVDAGLLRVESEILDVVDGTIVIPPGSPCEDAPSGS